MLSEVLRLVLPTGKIADASVPYNYQTVQRFVHAAVIAHCSQFLVHAMDAMLSFP